MQRLIMNAPEGLVVDHIDGDTLNNVRSNLRLCTQRQNQFNRRGKRNSSSRFRGVNLHRRHWRAEIFCLDGSRKYLGSFDNEVDAARAWNAAAIVEHGEFARLNVIEE